MPDYSNQLVDRSAPRWAWDKIDEILARGHHEDVAYAMMVACENPELEEVPPPIMEGGEFTDEYELVRDEVFPSLEAALAAAEGNERRIWFIREGDEGGTEACADCGDVGDIVEDGDDHWICGCGHRNKGPSFVDYKWDVERWRGQFVNCLGFFVTTEPCKPEHDIAIFTH